ncbi:MAG: DUF4340 domain-containing protein [Cellulosilyticaceae bacterium]
MKKQKMLGLAILLVVLLAGSYGAYKWYEHSKTEVLETVETILCNIETNQLERVELKFTDMTAFMRKNGQWVREGQEDLVYDQELMNALIADFARAVSYEKVSNVQDMTVYGIDEHAPIVTLYDKAGNVQTFRIGKDVSGRDATYIALDQNDEELYAVSHNKLGLIKRDPRGFIKKSLGLQKQIALLQSLEIQVNGEVKLKSVRSPQQGSVGYEKWILEAPFTRSHEASTSAMNQLIQGINELTKDYLVADLTEQTKSQYGLLEPRLRLILDEKTEIVFGKTENEFSYFYISSEPYIFKMPTSKIVAYEEVNAFNMIRKQIYVPDVAELAEVQVTYGKETFSVKWVSDLENTTHRTTYVNDQVVSDEMGKDLVGEIANLAIHSKLMNAELEQNQEREAEVVIRYIFNNHAVKTIELRPFDPSYYVLKDNGTIEFVVEKKQFINIWNKLQKAKEIS